MTRYARARGSKASNERLPNEATPWHMMKQQIEENENKKVLEKKISVKELLKDKNDTFENNPNKNVDQNWTEFDDNRSKSDIKEHKKSKSKKNCTNFTENSKNDIASDNNNAETESIKIETTNNKLDEFSNKIKPKKRNINNSHVPANETESIISQDGKNSNSFILSKRQKRNRKRKLESSNDRSQKFKKDTSDKSSKVGKKKPKERGEYKRRKPNVGDTKMIINGVEIEIVMYDGFPVKKEDAERLTELKQKLIIKGKYTYVRYYKFKF